MFGFLFSIYLPVVILTYVFGLPRRHFTVQFPPAPFSLIVMRFHSSSLESAIVVIIDPVIFTILFRKVAADKILSHHLDLYSGSRFLFNSRRWGYYIFLNDNL